MNVFEFISVLVLMVVGAIVYTVHMRAKNKGLSAGEDETKARLREELVMLKDRMAVLERITLEKENSLERQIEQLRDR